MELKQYKMVYWPIENLIQYENNTKTHPDTQVEKIARSIELYGFDQPISVDSQGIIIKGHGRLMAAKFLGLDVVPVIIRDDLDLMQAAASRIADNRVAESPWDEDLLPIELTMLEESGINLINDIGFSEIEIEQLFGQKIDDHKKEWQDMPEFTQEDKESFRSIKVHFRDNEAANDFAQLLMQNITNKTKFLWFPAMQNEKVADKRYSNES